jgi:hypothetical protein
MILEKIIVKLELGTVYLKKIITIVYIDTLNKKNKYIYIPENVENCKI